MKTQVFSGARAVFKIEGKVVGYTVGLSGTAAINYQPLNVLGTLAVVEHVPVAYTVEMNSQFARIAGASGGSATSRLANVQNGIPQPSGIPEAAKSQSGESPQIMPAYSENGVPILESGELTATVFDVVTASTLYTVSGVKCSSKAWDIAHGSMVTENCAFVARIMNEGGESTTSLGE